MKKNSIIICIILTIIALIIAGSTIFIKSSIAEKTGEEIIYTSSSITSYVVESNGNLVENRGYSSSSEYGGQLQGYHTIKDLDSFWWVICNDQYAGLIYERYDKDTIRKVKTVISEDANYWHVPVYRFDDISLSVKVDSKNREYSELMKWDNGTTVTVTGEHGVEYEVSVPNATMDALDGYGLIYMSKMPDTNYVIRTSESKNAGVNGAEYNPELAYAMSTAIENNSNKDRASLYSHENNELQKYIWGGDSKLKAEAEKFGNYRDQIKANDSLMKIDDGERDVLKNTKEDAVIVGPFRIQYVESYYENKDFAVITNATLYTNAGELEKTKWEFVLSEDHDDHGNGYKYPNNEEEFYIKIKEYSKLKDSINKLTKVDFEYEILNVEAAWYVQSGGEATVDTYSFDNNDIGRGNINEAANDGKTISDWLNNYPHCKYGPSKIIGETTVEGYYRDGFFCSGGEYCSSCGHIDCTKNSNGIAQECDECESIHVDGDIEIKTLNGYHEESDIEIIILGTNGIEYSCSYGTSTETIETKVEELEKTLDDVYYYCYECDTAWYYDIGNPIDTVCEAKSQSYYHCNICGYNSISNFIGTVCEYKKQSHIHNAKLCDCEIGRYWRREGISGYLHDGKKYDKYDGIWKYIDNNNYEERFRIKLTSSETAHMQELFIIDYTKRWIDKYKITIEFKDGDDDGIPLTMELGGKVWEDEPLNKASTVDGVITKDSSGKVVEKFIKGIEVELYNSENKKIKTAITNDKGEYKFEDLPLDKYYVKFIYDGLNYEPTDYLIDCTENCAKHYSKYDYGDTYAYKCHNNSKAKESEKDRLNFNNKFAEIRNDGAHASNGSVTKLQYDKSQVDGNGNPVVKVITTNSDGTIKPEFKMTASSAKYPVDDNFNASKEDIELNGTKYYAIYDYCKNINLGLKERNKTYMAARISVKAVDVGVYRGSTKEDTIAETYGNRSKIDAINLTPRTDETGYYSMEQKASIQKETYDDNEITFDAYVTYVVTLKNSSELNSGYITTFDNYYDTSYLQLVKINSQDLSSSGIAGASTTVKAGNKTYKKQEINFYQMLKVGETAEIELTYKIVKDIRSITNISTNQAGEKVTNNFVEISGYKMVTNSDKTEGNLEVPAGLVDMYSIPGNLSNALLANQTEQTLKELEEDSDLADGVRFVREDQYEVVISGNVWEDSRETNNQGVDIEINSKKYTQIVSNQKNDSGELKAEGIKVLLQRKNEQRDANGNLISTSEQNVGVTYTDANGNYAFHGEITNERGIKNTISAGKYYVKFEYGNLTSAQQIKYNGQDFQVVPGPAETSVEEQEQNIVIILDTSYSMNGTYHSRTVGHYSPPTGTVEKEVPVGYYEGGTPGTTTTTERDGVTITTTTGGSPGTFVQTGTTTVTYTTGGSSPTQYYDYLHNVAIDALIEVLEQLDSSTKVTFITFDDTAKVVNTKDLFKGIAVHDLEDNIDRFTHLQNNPNYNGIDYSNLIGGMNSYQATEYYREIMKENRTLQDVSPKEVLDVVKIMRIYGGRETAYIDNLDYASPFFQGNTTRTDKAFEKAKEIMGENSGVVFMVTDGKPYGGTAWYYTETREEVPEEYEIKTNTNRNGPDTYYCIIPTEKTEIFVEESDNNRHSYFKNYYYYDENNNKISLTSNQYDMAKRNGLITEVNAGYDYENRMPIIKRYYQLTKTVSVYEGDLKFDGKTVEERTKEYLEQNYQNIYPMIIYIGGQKETFAYIGKKGEKYSINQYNHASGRVEKKEVDITVEGKTAVPGAREVANIIDGFITEIIANLYYQQFYERDSDAMENVEDRKRVNNSSVEMTSALGNMLEQIDSKTINKTNTDYTKVTAKTNDIIITTKHRKKWLDGQIGMGLVERPRTDLDLNIEIANFSVTLSDGTKLIDTTSSDVKGVNNWGANKVGQISAYIDEELMQGATLSITYNVNIKNNSQVDSTQTVYPENTYTTQQVVKTKASQIRLYTGNNLVFRQDDNKEWNASEPNGEVVLNSSSSNKLTKDLLPGESVNTSLTLTKVISPENNVDSMEYQISGEIIERWNTVGRRDYDAVPGNGVRGENDDDTARRVVLLPPFGEQYIYYVLGGLCVIILAAGIVLIKKKVLK